MKTALARQAAQLSVARLSVAQLSVAQLSAAPPSANADDPPRPLPVADLAASFQAAVVRAIAERLQRAVAEHPARAIAVSGGVSANTALRTALATAFDIPILFPPLALCTDNAAMIAAAGWFAWERGAGGDGLGFDVRADWGLG